MHNGRAVDWKNVVSWYRPYPLKVLDSYFFNCVSVSMEVHCFCLSLGKVLNYLPLESTHTHEAGPLAEYLALTGRRGFLWLLRVRKPPHALGSPFLQWVSYSCSASWAYSWKLWVSMTGRTCLFKHLVSTNAQFVSQEYRFYVWVTYSKLHLVSSDMPADPRCVCLSKTDEVALLCCFFAFF